jgi:alpha-glucan,water dikinase
MAETLHPKDRAGPGDGPSVTAVAEDNQLTVVVGVRSRSDCVLHWGLSRRPGGAWQRPPEAAWPEGTTPAGDAVRTPLAPGGTDERRVTIRLDLPSPWRSLPFVLHFPRENRWLKDGGRDFSVPIPNGHAGRSPEEALASWETAPDAVRQVLTLDGGERLAVATWKSAEAVRVRMVCGAAPPLALHWGLAWRFPHEWQLPPESLRPAGTYVLDGQAARTPFAERDGLLCLELAFPKPPDGPGPRGLRFVLYQDAPPGWLKSGGKDVYLPLFDVTGDPRLPSPGLWDLAAQIVAAEKGAGSWTLMHRFNLCYDLLDGAREDEDALALLFAWLRYSATRQLDWQRNYNTKPRELSHAQDRLTARLAGLWRGQAARPACRTWSRLLLTTLGRGGDGQRIRDEILQIMHRNHIKEMSGHFMEEWHQKLHNNTTPDDVVICSAYLAFLRSGGDVPTFYRTLEAGGVTRDRLRSFERPIRSDPDFYPGRKDALIGEFEHFLTTLKAVHSGTDLDSAAAAARGRLDGGRARDLDAVFSLRHRRAGARELAAAITAAREGLRGALAAARDDAAVRDLLFLDLALEEALRGAVERQDLSRAGRDELADLAGRVMKNLYLSADAPELALCAAHWEALLARPRDGRDWALHARSVADRAGRWVQDFTDAIYRRLQPRAEFLGEAFGVDRWAVPLFSEEVVRGGPAFALSLLLRHLDRVLRQAAGLGGWQVISPAAAFGRVRLADRLLAVQGERFAEPTVLVADAVGGEEEIPEGATAVVTADAPDLLSHVAVRARNARVLFATCFDPETYGRLKALKGKTASLRVTPGGDVQYEEAAAAPAGGAAADKAAPRAAARGTRRRAAAWVVAQELFGPEVVGGKGNNLNGLRGRLPDWIHLPRSLALPFGTCENVLQDDANRAARREYEALAAAAADDPAGVLPRLRALLLGLAPPPALKDALLGAWQAAGLPPVPWEKAWHAVRRVWASKWNDRAFFSRRAHGLADEQLLMAVLIQQVVEADYAFVIHTANPLTGDPGELYAEVVLGLGEALVGNYPGRALGFVCRKDDLKPRLLSYPGKGLGLYGRGVIFRSDSTGEDLEGFAGAGLYDSVLAEEPERRLLNYRGERLVWDADFQGGLLRAVARVGLAVEAARGSAQDVEGAVAGGNHYVVQARPQVGLGGERGRG